MMKTVAILLAMVSTLSAAGVELEVFSFNPDAVLDTTQVIDQRANPYRVERPDWSEAFEQCRKAGFTEVECISSVNEGEF